MKRLRNVQGSRYNSGSRTAAPSRVLCARGKTWMNACASFLLLSLAAFTAHAQISTGSVSGTVFDSSGAVIDGASVTLINNDTGVQRTTQTTQTGRYSLTEVEPGRYSLRVE